MVYQWCTIGTPLVAANPYIQSTYVYEGGLQNIRPDVNNSVSSLSETVCLETCAAGLATFIYYGQRMLSYSTGNKIRTTHLERVAFIYVRQSTIQQVRENLTSSLRQYDLKQRALELGWREDQIIIIDQDQGRSGSSIEGRDGFKTILTEIALGKVGAILSLEASRLARDSSDWHILLKLCNYFDTLIIDEQSVFDSRNENDRLCLGIKGTFSELELNLIKNRMAGGVIKKAQEGKFYTLLPIGLNFDTNRNVILDPDEEIQNSIRYVLSLLDRFSSLHSAVRHFNEHKLLFPSRHRSGPKKGVVEWIPLTYARARDVVINPAYAGTYVYGRSKVQKIMSIDGMANVKRRIVRLKRDDWEIVILGAHEGYISWEQYLHNIQRLQDNRFIPEQGTRGAAKSGLSLLQGIVLCGKCGRKMSVEYPNISKHSYYVCPGERISLRVKRCQTIAAWSVDEMITSLLFQAFQPAQLQISINAFERIEAQSRGLERQWQLRVERAQYEADLAYRQFNQVDPQNRLVAGTLERIWNEKLVEVDRLKSEHANLQNNSLSPLSRIEQQSIMDLAADIKRVWTAPSTTQVERKRLIRLLFKDITLFKETHQLRYSVKAGIRWQTGACEEVYFSPLTRVGRPKTAAHVIALIRKLAIDHTDQEIADHLNMHKFKSRNNLEFNWSMVRHVRQRFNIKAFTSSATNDKGQSEDGRYTIKAATKLLNICYPTVQKWIKKGLLIGVRVKPYNRWLVTITPEAMKLSKSK